MSIDTWVLRAPSPMSRHDGWAWIATGAVAAAVSQKPDETEDRDSAVSVGTLADFVAARAAMPLSVVLLLPVSMALVVPVNAPLRQQRQLLSALPYLVEDTLAGEVERMHVIAGVRIDAQRLQVIAVERDTLRQVLAQLQSAGIDPGVVTLDALALEQAGSVILEGGRSLVFATDGHALQFDAQDADAVLAHCTEPPQMVAGPLLESLAARDSKFFAKLPNLRQGEFAKIGATDFSLGFDWRPLAWLAAVWMVVALGYEVAVGVSYSRAADATRMAQVDLYKQLFPGANQVPKPRQQMEGMIASASAQNGGFVPLMARTSEALAEVGGTSAGFTPQNLAWDNAQHQLHMDVVTHNIEDIDRLRGALQKRGLRVDIGAGVAQEGGYKARVNVGEGA